MSRKETLQNVLDMLAVFQALFLFSQNRSVELDTQTMSGHACILSCIMEALHFEIDYRINK